MIINMADSFLAWDVDDLENTIPNCSNVYHIPQFIRQPFEHAHVFELGLASGRREGSTSARQWLWMGVIPIHSRIKRQTRGRA